MFLKVGMLGRTLDISFWLNSIIIYSKPISNLDRTRNIIT